MKNIFIGFFVIAPLYIITFLSIITVIIPISYWLLCKEDYVDDCFELINDIEFNLIN